MKPDANPTIGRTAVLEALRAGEDPQSAADLGLRLGLHPNTVRGHLELLVHLGYATRATEERTERGRPKVLYRAVTNDIGAAEAYRGLATALAAELAVLGATDQETADRAGEKWAGALAQQGRLSPQASPEAAVDHVASLFAEMGFQVATEPMGDRIYLQQCPYREIVDRYPNVCSLHLGLMRGAFAEAGDQVSVDRLDIDAKPGLCIAALRINSDPSLRNQKETA